ncbi:hypothetical protein OMP38_14540 [Cohnella ginsengisoli]|uniref:Uncharacterized protein n=1 Tax=Cohnella ginsengisoli TaxID=425004 RepID=A0A9X4KH83_9BACL|nr:hypothetical protein [Cohnella ginsengisoli]MDG0791935.1 hypothetical protein [Cohnella ginsengisoli]
MTDAERIVHYEDELKRAEQRLEFINVPCPARDRQEGVVKALKELLAGLYQKVS